MKYLLRLVVVILMVGSAYAQSYLRACQGSDTSRWSNCVGTVTFASGDKYVGEYKDGKRNGQGTATFPSGSKYVGEFKDGKYNGQGTYTFANGSKYVGEFKDDKRHGQGTYYASNGSIIGQGIWTDGSFVRSAPVQQPHQMQN